MAQKITNREKSTPASYGRVRSPEGLGRLVREERKRQGLTLDKIYSVSGLTTRFLSEFERGKPNASIGRVMKTLQVLGLEVLVLPRGEAERLLALRRKSDVESGTSGEDDT